MVATDNAALIAAAKRYGAEKDINPYIALLEEVRRTAGHVTWLGWKVQDAPTDDELLGTYLPWLKLYNAERDRLVKVCSEAVRLGLEERVVRMEERKAELMARAFIAALEELGLPPEYMERAPAALRRQLLAIEAQAT